MSKLFENACNITATINIEPLTQIDLSEGDVLTEDLFADTDDEELLNLISIVDEVVVEEVIGANVYKINATITDDVAAVSLYQWIYANTNIRNDEDLEEYVAPGLAALVNRSSATDNADVEDLDDTADYEALADETDNMYNESVSSRFAKYRKLYEAAHAMNEAEALNDDKEEGSDDAGADDFSDIFGDAGDAADDNGDDKADDENADKDSEETTDKDSDDSEDEDVPMTAVVLTVKKEDADKCKDEMVDAGIPEEDIEIIDGEEEDDNTKIKVDANSVKELKDYLSKKGIDLEEKIGGEIVDDDEESEESSDDEGSEEGDGDKEGSDDGFDDLDLGDLFGDDEGDSDDSGEGEEK